MSYFPAYIKIDDKKVLLIGGGEVAHKKLKHLLDFTKNISILAKNINKEIEDLSQKFNLKIEKKAYCKGDIDMYEIIIIAVDDIALQKDIYDESRVRDKLCNAVDSTDYCDFIFPSYIKKDDLTISISTAGTSPSTAKYLKGYIEKFLPKDLDKFLKKMKEYRKELPKGKSRMKFLDDTAKRYFEKEFEGKNL